MSKTIKILLWILGITIIASLIWLWSNYSGFEYGKKVEISFSFIGAIIGGITTLIAVFFTIKQTREVQDENKNENRKIKEIDSLKTQIEYSKNLFQYAYNYQLYLENLDNELDKILRRTNFLNKKDNSEKEMPKKEDIKYKNPYEAMRKEEEILFNLDIASKLKVICNTMEEHTKRIMIESASIMNLNINSMVRGMFEKLFGNTELVSTIIQKNENIEDAKEILHDKESDVNLTLELLASFQYEIQKYIENCQIEISNIIYNNDDDE